MAEESSVRVIERACVVLDCFTADRPRLQISDIRTMTSLPTTTVARLVRSLVSMNLLERSGDEYRLGLRVLVWAAPAKIASDLITAASPIVEYVRDVTRETAGLQIRQGTSRVTVVSHLATYALVYGGYVGQIMPVQAGAAGKVFMAFDPGALSAALDEGLPVYTPKTVSDPDVLHQRLDVVRSQGWAFATSEREIGLNSIAAPVFGGSGALIASLAIGGPESRLTPARAEELGPLLREAALSLSKSLGYTQDLPAIARNSSAANQ